MDYRDIEWFALEMNRDYSVVFEIASKYCISDSFVDHDGYAISSTPPSSRAEGLLFLHGLESNPGSSLQTEEEAGLP